MKKITDISQIATCIDTYNLQSFLVHDLLSISELYTFEKEEHLIQSQTPSDYLYFLIKGTVRVYTYSSETQNIVINRSQPITLLGEASSLWDLLPQSNVKAETDCLCLGISLKKHRELLQHDVRLLQNICQILSYRLNSGVNLANSLTEPVETRLAKFILENNNNQKFTCQLTTCAAILNVSYRHLLRTMTSFKEENILKKQNSYYIIVNKAQLEKIAENLQN
ncbi:MULTISPECIES: cyclic nucleotide-binding domain-containing protein [Streptococcaceae]|jgi:CRP-like cAMP-binding protein|uniref:Putative DNA-binding transcriptional activator YeiL n=1 Tax=Pseudolactococcus piscium MKFS47 TaxID=297352 RepID=A0A0D6DY96_9LACT|nr:MULTISPECIES: cyclic nucleotide-binding domain-containing protein [Lactococcus]MBQ2635211.1 cyclic nucleotide-binding domain-containing protein [Methanobrevibacter sp.]MBQ9658990.1 cyclic nucleotide-binding domain-containing protein [Clostridia bacterium]MDN5464983.1 cyclic nucleotide-binding domain-containing protein [Lactococcus lactis]MCJ1970351.1 cyclic nucleotide-binding domain-containing protein [Lactococcus carnosus]MDN5409881.1 cyclic nucleotide-binding domain-containing protein [La